MLRKIFLFLLGLNTLTSFSQEIITPAQDSTFFTEFRDGKEWCYQAKKDFIVGINNQLYKDDYGTYYQIRIAIQNLSSSPYLFDPDAISSKLVQKNGETIPLKVYSNEALQKKIKRTQMWAMILTGISNGISDGMSAYQTSYVTQRVGNYYYTQPITTYNYSNASAEQIASNTQLMIMGRQMELDRKIREEGYLKKNTINAGEGIVGYMNIKRQKGKIMTVTIPINETDYIFEWNLEKTKK